MQQFKEERLQFEEMIKQMDSLRNQLLKERYPEIQQNKTKPTTKNLIIPMKFKGAVQKVFKNGKLIIHLLSETSRLPCHAGRLVCDVLHINIL